jgi:hypothetical protein
MNPNLIIFAFFLKYFELSNPMEILEQATLLIKQQLRQEFINTIDRSYSNEKIDMLYKIHNGI